MPRLPPVTSITPALIALLDQAPPAITWQAEDLLCRLAGEQQPAITLDPLSRFDFLDIRNVRREMPEHNFKAGGVFTAEQHKRFYELQAQVEQSMAA